MNKLTLYLEICLVSILLLTTTGCKTSNPKNESKISGVKNDLGTDDGLQNVFLDKELLSASAEFSAKALQISKQQQLYLDNSVTKNKVVLSKEFQEKTAIWTSLWEEMYNTFENHPVTWGLEAEAKSIAASSLTFSDLYLIIQLMHRRYTGIGFIEIGAEVIELRQVWLKQESKHLKSSITRKNNYNIRFTENKDLDLMTTIAGSFGDWLKELASCQNLLTRYIATSGEEKQIYGERKGRLDRLRENVLPFWQQKAAYGLNIDSQQNLALTYALDQITDDYIEARLNLGTYLDQKNSFSFEYSLLIIWGLNDLFCRSVYLAVLSDDLEWLQISSSIIEIQMLTADIMDRMLSIL